MFKTYSYSKLQSHVQSKKNKTNVQDFDNILKIPFGYLGVFNLDFFRPYETFFRKFFGCNKGSRFNFLILCNRMNVNKSQRPPFSNIFRHYETIQNYQFWFFSKYFCMSPKGPLSLFWYFATNWIFEYSKRSPFSTLWDFSKWWFLVGAFSLKEKSPTLTVSSFFLFFFSWQSHSEWSTFLTICSSFIFVHLPSSTQPESVGSILPLSHKFFNAFKSTGETKGSPLWVFFRHYATFFENFWNLSKGTPLDFFEVFGL